MGVRDPPETPRRSPPLRGAELTDSRDRPGAAIPAATSGDVSKAPPFELVFEWTVGGNQDLYVVGAEGGPPRRLTTDPHVDALPRWSPDGERIFFTSDRAGNWQVYSVPAGGGPARRVRTNRAPRVAGGAVAGWPRAGPPLEPGRPGIALRDGPGHGRGADARAPRPPHRPRQPELEPRRAAASCSRPTGPRASASTSWTWRRGEEQPLTRAHPTGCEPRFHPDGRRVVYVRRGGQGDTEPARRARDRLRAARRSSSAGPPSTTTPPTPRTDRRSRSPRTSPGNGSSTGSACPTGTPGA